MHRRDLLNLAASVLLCGLPARTAELPRTTKLRARLQSLAARHGSRMKVGIAAIHLPTGDQVSIQGGTPYPLASVFKVPIMVELCRQMQTRETGLELNGTLVITEREKCIGSGRLKHRPNGSKVTVAQAIELMETISDNTATDMLFQRIGLDSVNRLMAKLGLKKSDIYITNRAAWLVSLGLGKEFAGLTPGQIAARWKRLDAAARRQAAVRILEENKHLSLAEFQAAEDASQAMSTGARYWQDVDVAAATDNLASPEDMARLLAMLYRGEILDPRWTRYCMDVLGRQKFNSRIPRKLPRHVQTYHKTGTIIGVVNDIGVVEITPDNAFTLAVLIRDVAEGWSDSASLLIGDIAHATYTAWA